MSFCPSKDIHSVYLDGELPENYKAEVLVNGTLTPYFSTPGVKTVTEFQLLTDENPEAIHGISVAGKLDAIFTIAGQRVVRMAKPGLFIVGGKKVLMK